MVQTFIEEIHDFEIEMVLRLGKEDAVAGALEMEAAKNVSRNYLPLQQI